MNDPVDFSIITPSRNQLAYLKRCHASVMDQQGVTVEHLVMDGASTDGTVDWLRRRDDLAWASKPDSGMYEAINHGLDRARGRFIAYLNCDEQYLPGTLARVKRNFELSDKIDALYGDMLVVGPDGDLLAFRKSPVLRLVYLRFLHLYVPSCATFWRRRIIDDGNRFDPAYKAAGDYELCLRLLKTGRYRFVQLRAYLAAFTFTGTNLGHSPPPETRRFRRKRLAGLPWRAMYLAEKIIAGYYWQTTAINYAVYTPESPAKRQAFKVKGCPCKWPK